MVEVMPLRINAMFSYGVDFAYCRNQAFLSRTLQVDFSIGRNSDTKRAALMSWENCVVEQSGTEQF